MTKIKPPLRINFTNKDISKIKLAVIFDRDGVVNKKAKPHQHIKNIKETKMIPDFYKLIQLLKANQDKCAILLFTNQRWIANNKNGVEDFTQTMEFMRKKILQNSGVEIDSAYCCPHEHEDPKCNCRKPKPGMLNSVLKDYQLSPNQCIVIGDTDFDMQTAKNAGIKNTILISTDKPAEAHDSLIEFLKH